MGRVIYWEVCKRLHFDHTTKWYMPKTESVQENEVHKILWDLETQTKHLISSRPSANYQLINQLIKNEKITGRFVDFAIVVDLSAKIKENKKIAKYLDLVRELKKSYGTWGWQRYQLLLVYLERSPKKL